MKPTAAQIQARLSFHLQEYEKHRSSLKELTPENRTLRIQDTAAIQALQELQLWINEQLLENVMNPRSVEPSPPMPDYSSEAVRAYAKDVISKAVERWPIYPLSIELPESIENLLNAAEAVKQDLERNTLYNPHDLNYLMQQSAELQKLRNINQVEPLIEFTNLPDRILKPEFADIPNIMQIREREAVEQQSEANDLNSAGEASEAGHNPPLRQLFAEFLQNSRKPKIPKQHTFSSDTHPHIWPKFDFVSLPAPDLQSFDNSILTLVRISLEDGFYLVPFRFVYWTAGQRIRVSDSQLSRLAVAINNLYKTADQIPETSKYRDQYQLRT